MPDIDNQTISAPVAVNWKENLLLKDEQGLLSYYQKKQTPASSAASDRVDLPKTATEEHFREDNYAKFRGKSSDKADFHFHPEDKKDLEVLAGHLPQDESKKYSVEKISAKIIEKQNLNLAGEDRKKFIEAIFNFLRNRKNSISTRIFISEKVKSDGRLLPEKTIDAIMSVAKGIKEKISATGGLVVWQPAPVTAPEIKDDKLKLKTIVLEENEDLSQPPQAEIDNALAGLALTQKPNFSLPDDIAKTQDANESKQDSLGPEKKTEALAEKLDKKDQAGKEETKKDEPSPALEQPLQPLKSQASAKEDFSLPQEKTVSDNDKENLPKVLRPQAMPAKKQLADVLAKASSVSRPAPKAVLTGPVMEIGSLDLTAFRRLGQSPQERVEKILAKINLLEKDSFTKKAQGIAAWRNSPLHQLYLSLGAKSMGQGQAIEEFLAQRQQADASHLAIEEFSAIADLNKKLRF
ncbi:MAG: hypothetical protein PHO91_02715 [Patescibacteria group bacterium]|nr:hypothetical protein [Patescibacteria group bacterium]